MTNHQDAETSIRPRIYVAASDHGSAGRATGAWINADQSSDTIAAEVESMLKSSPHPEAKQWTIDEYEGFGPVQLDGGESLEDVSALARLLPEYGHALGAWYRRGDWQQWDKTLEQAFSDGYLGTFSSLSDYAKSVSEDIDLGEKFGANDYSAFEAADALAKLWPFIRIDWDRAGLAFGFAADIWTAPSGLDVHVFRGR